MKTNIIILALATIAACSDDDRAAPYVCHARNLPEAEACAWELACPSHIARHCYETVPTADELGQCVVDICSEVCGIIKCVEDTEATCADTAD